MATTRKKFINHDSVNLMPLVTSSLSSNGVSCTSDTYTGELLLNGTSTAPRRFILTNDIILQKGTYTLAIYGEKVNGWGVYLGVYNTNTILGNIVSAATTQTSIASSFTIDSEQTVQVWISINVANLAFSNLVVKPMLLRDDMTSNLPPFEPYYDHKTIYKTYTRTANLIKITNWYTTISGLTITQKPNDSNTVTITGTSSRGAQAIANKNFYTADMLGKTITFSQSKKFTAWNDPAATFWQIWRDGKVYKITPTSSQTVTFEEGHTWSINVWCGTAGEKNYTISFWANEGTVAKPFQPYSTVTYKKHIVEGT